MSLPVVGAAAASGTVFALARGTLPLGPALDGPATMAGLYAGAWLASFLDGRTQLVLLAIIMLTAAGAMWIRARQGGDLQAAAHPRPALVIAIGRQRCGSARGPSHRQQLRGSDGCRFGTASHRAAGTPCREKVAWASGHEGDSHPARAKRAGDCVWTEADASIIAMMKPTGTK